MKKVYKKIRIDFNKNTKLFYYLKNSIRFLLPSFLFESCLKQILNSTKDDEYIQKRIGYYIKINQPFKLDASCYDKKTFFYKEKKKTYFFDLLYYLKYFDSDKKISYLFGDITHIPQIPSFVKSRPIADNNQNSILFNLNKIRHFIFVNDLLPFEKKKDQLVWRGKTVNEQRKIFVKNFYKHPLCNVGQVNTKGDLSVAWQKKRLTLKEQLEYKFILSLEGNDVASNLKWIMSSNSLVFMPKPHYETWFMEGVLIPNFHYVLLKDDLSDIDEKIQYYATNIKEAKKIINNAHLHVEQFKNKKREDAIALGVLDKYFELAEIKN